MQYRVFPSTLRRSLITPGCGAPRLLMLFYQSFSATAGAPTLLFLLSRQRLLLDALLTFCIIFNHLRNSLEAILGEDCSAAEYWSKALRLKDRRKDLHCLSLRCFPVV